MRDFRPEVVWMDTNALVPYELNSKMHPQDQVNRLARNMEKFGFDIPNQQNTLSSGIFLGYNKEMGLK